jgi:phosphodiester glycosidase
MVRKALIAAAFAALALPGAAGAAAQPTLLMPGVTYSRQVQFTPHGPVVIHVLISPRPKANGLWGLHPVLGRNAIQGRETVTGMQKDVSSFATVAGTNGDLFQWSNGRPTGIVMQGGVVKHTPSDTRSSVGIDEAGNLSVQRVQLFGTWRGTGQRRPFSGVNDLPPANGVSLYTPAWGPVTPPVDNSFEAQIASFPPATANTDLAGQVTGVAANASVPIPPNGAVLVARGVTAQKLAAEAPVGTVVAMRLILKPTWAGMVDAIGGGPAIVRNGRPIFRANEGFSPSQLQPRDPRTGVGQLRDGRIIQVVVDGRQPGYSTGVTNFELAQAMVRLGAVTASALDSGGSSTLAFDGKLLNRPSDPGGQRAVKECLCVFYYGVYAPPPSAPVLSPNGDKVDETQALAFKVVRPSSVTATIVGPDHVARVTQTSQSAPGLYKLSWNGLTSTGTSEREGLWHWTVTATDDLGRKSTVDRTFWLNNTLGYLRVPGRVAVGKRPAVVARFQVAHPARVIVRIETRTGVILRSIVRTVSRPGTVAVGWNGRVGRSGHGPLVYSGRYLVEVSTQNALGQAQLSKPLTVKRVAAARKKKR